MKDDGHAGAWRVLGLCLAAMAVSGAACTGSGISKARMAALKRDAKAHGVIIGFEGLQPFSGHRADELTREVAQELHLAHVATTGNPSACMPLVKAAHAKGQPIYIVGYSLGGVEARRLAERCRKADIPVDILFLLDAGAMGVFTGKIPANVHRVIFYMSGTYDSSLLGRPDEDFLEDPGGTRVEFQDLSHLNHMNLPSYLADRIIYQVQGQ